MSSCQGDTADGLPEVAVTISPTTTTCIMQDDEDSHKKRNAPEGHIEEKSPIKRARPDAVYQQQQQQQQPVKVRHFPSCGGLHPNLATPTGDLSAYNGSFPNDEHQYQYGVPTGRNTTTANNEQEASGKMHGNATTNTQSALSSTTTILDGYIRESKTMPVEQQPASLDIKPPYSLHYPKDEKMPFLPSNSTMPKEPDEKYGDDSKMSADAIRTTPTRLHISLSSKFLKMCGKSLEDTHSHIDAKPNSDWVLQPTDTKTIDAHLQRIAFGVVIAWVSLLLLIWIIVPNERMERLEGLEQSAALLAFILMFVSFFSKLSTFFFYITPTSQRKPLNGVLMCGLAVQSISMTTDFYMASGLPTPIIYDPVFNSRIHLLRWCEWSCLAFVMTFLVEAIGVPDPKTGLLIPYFNASCQSLSTFCGLVFGFLPGPKSWSVVMVISCLLYSVLFPRLYYKRRAFKNMVKGTTVDEVELYDRERLSVQLFIMCTIVWSLIVIMYFVSSTAGILAPENSFLKTSSLTMISDCMMDVLSKSLFLNTLIEVHDLVFDETKRADRRLDELRQMMGVVWDSSSDVIAISVKGMNGGITTMVSSTFSKMYGRNKKRDEELHGDRNKSANAFVFELDSSDFTGRDMKDELNRSISDPTKPSAVPMIPATKPQPVEPKAVYSVNFEGMTSLSNPAQYTSKKPMKWTHSTSKDKEEISSMADLILRAWVHKEKEIILMHDLIEVQEPSTMIRCEAKVSRLEDNSLIVVMRDVSERFRRFEAEKTVISQATARTKDAEANRFTRHEVKNGLLSAIGLCESLKESLQNAGNNMTYESSDSILASSSSSNVLGLMLRQRDSMASMMLNNVVANRSSTVSQMRASKCLKDLDKTLRGILDTVLSEAMARDVIHESYEPKLERVDIEEVLSTAAGPLKTRNRFPIITIPSPLPRVLLDPQLLTYIHRNALSNACKYGLKGGVVTTMIKYIKITGQLEMDVINLPGDFHEEITQMGDEAKIAVFSPNTCIHRQLRAGASANPALGRHSAGDGAWIMLKCAKTLGGDCDIQFEPTRTVFTLRCPVTPYDDAVNSSNSQLHPSLFALPSNTWGVAIDDSNIQRKLMGRFLEHCGIDKSRSIILGKDAAEIEAFSDFVVQLVAQHPEDYIFIVADENLDIVEGSTRHVTISGSLCIENIRQRLSPEQEKMVLAVVRSANDSSNDVALYNSRSHGFLPKAPISRDRVLQCVAPLWQQRFKTIVPSSEELLDTSVHSNMNNFHEEFVAELINTIQSIDVLCENEALLRDQWVIIWEKLHALKGDMLSLFMDVSSVTRIVNTITSLRGPEVPHDFLSKWAALKTDIKSVIGMTVKE